MQLVCTFTPKLTEECFTNIFLMDVKSFSLQNGFVRILKYFLENAILKHSFTVS